MVLESIDFLNGIFAVIWVVISTFIGLKITSIYKKHKDKTLIYVGLAWIGTAIAWYPTCISFLLIIFTGISLTPELYFLIGIVYLPIALFLWMIAINELLLKKKNNILLIFYAATGALFEFFFIYFVFIDSSVIGVLNGPVDVQYKGFTMFYLIFAQISLLTTGILFSLESLQSDKPEIRLKGKFLIIAFILSIFGAVGDAFFPLNYITLPIIRIIMILGGITFYCGWIMPNSIKNLVLKNSIAEI